MPIAVHGRPVVVKALIEDMILGLGVFPHVKWVKIHEGEEQGNGQSTEPSRLHTRTYRLYVDEKPTRTKVTFKFDLRKNWSNVSMSLDSLDALKETMAKLRKEEAEEEVIEL